MASEARIGHKVAPSPDREPQLEPPGNVQRDANIAQVANRPGYPNPVQPVRRRRRHREGIAPSIVRRSSVVRSTLRPVRIGTYRLARMDTQPDRYPCP